MNKILSNWNYTFFKRTRMGFLEVSANPLLYLQQCTRLQHIAGLWWNGNMLGRKVDYSLRTAFPPWMCCHPLFQHGRQSPYPWKPQSLHALWSSSQVALWKSCRLSWLSTVKKPVMTSHGPHRYGDFRLFPTGNQVFIAACCCPAILVPAFRLFGVVGSTDAFTGSV